MTHDWELQHAYRQIRFSRYCWACQRHHEPGSFMAYHVCVADSHFGYGYVCVDCQGDIQYDRPPGRPVPLVVVF